MRRLVVLAVVLVSSGCFGSPTKPAEAVREPGPASASLDGPGSWGQAKEIHVLLQRPVNETGFRFSYALTARGECELRQYARWKIDPNEERPYYFAQFDGPSAGAMGVFVVRPSAQIHRSGGVDTRDHVPDPWWTLVPLDLEGNYEMTSSFKVGGRFAEGAFNFTMGARQLVPGANGASYKLDLVCSVPFDILELEHADGVHLFNMLSLDNGNGHSISNFHSKNEGDELQARLGAPTVRFLGYDREGQGDVRLQGPAGEQRWALPVPGFMFSGVGPAGDHKLVLNREGRGQTNSFQGMLAGFHPIPDLAQFQGLA